MRFFFFYVHDTQIFCNIVLFQASMTGSALSLYLEETKTNEDALFRSEISPIKNEGIHEGRNQSNLNLSTGARDISSQGKGDLSDILSPITLALHKVVLFGNDLKIHIRKDGFKRTKTCMVRLQPTEYNVNILYMRGTDGTVGIREVVQGIRRQ